MTNSHRYRRSCVNRLSRHAGLVLTALFILSASLVGIVSAAGAVTLDQCANGPFSAPTTTCNWQNGDLNGNNSHYSEGDYVPYREIISGLVPSTTYTTTIQFDFTESSGKHAFDYIGTYNNTVTGADLCAAGAGCLGVTNQYPIATDTTCSNAVPSTQQYFTVNGGEILSNTYLAHACQGGAIKVTYVIVFHATTSTVVIAWGGHISTQTDWGAGNGATNISGAPYHARVLDCTCVNGSVGNQDRSMMASAVAAVTMTTQRNPSTAIAAGQLVSDTATLVGSISAASPTGSVQFYICYLLNSDPTVFPTCQSSGDGTLLGSVTVSTSGSTGTASSPNFTASSSGSYCFLAVYTSTSLIYKGFADNITAANQPAECFFISFPTAVTIDRFGAKPVSELVNTSDALAFGLAAVGAAVLGLLALVFIRKR